MIRDRLRNSDRVPLRVGKKLIGALLVIGLPVAVFIFTFSIKNISVTGTQRYTPQQIKNQVIQTKMDHNSLYLYLKYKYFAKANIPFVEKIDVELMNTHSVNLTVYDRMVTGCIPFMSQYLYFDKDGIVVESSSKRLKDIPEIKGLKFDKIILHEKLKVQKDELFQVILNMTKLIDKYDLDVDTISFNSKYEVTVDCGGIKVFLGKKGTYDEPLSELKGILAKADGMNLMIDMSNYVKGSGSIVAKQVKPTE